VMIQATLPADQGAMVVKALQQVVSRKAGEREAYWEQRYASTFRGADADTTTTGAAASITDFNPDTAPSDSATPVERYDMDVAAVDVAAVDVTAAGTSTDTDGAPGDSAPVVELSDGDLVSNDQGAENVSEGTAAVHIATAGTSTHVDGTSRDRAPVVEPSDGDLISNDQGATNVSEGTSAQDDDDDIPLEGLLFERSYPEQRHADAMVDIAEHYLSSSCDPRKRRTGNRYEVVLHIERNELAAMGQQGESARFYVEPDWGLDESAARQISCDADLTEFIQDCTGNILDFKSRSRIVPARLKRAL
jgi:hypothetical protein